MNGSMASACATAATRPLVSAPSACPPSKKTAASARCRRRTVSCKAAGGDGRGSDDGLLSMPRRDVLLGGGLSGVAAGLAWYPGLASGEGLSCTTPDPVHENLLRCANTLQQWPCPPAPLISATDPVDFKPAAKVTRVRQAAHLLSRENQEKYKEAVAKMKDLPRDNPLSFAAQASIHEAYCDHYYKYLKKASTSTDGPIFDVHDSWLFAPWHRMYIYFYERALGQLIGDDTFALPFWNWDHPAGMGIPDIFKKAGSNVLNNGATCTNPLYDVNRNPLHIDAMVDLDYNFDHSKDIVPFKGPHDAKYEELVHKNLCTVYRQQVLDGRHGALAFLGEKYCTNMCDKGVSSQGSLERMTHGAVHVWTGKAGPTPSSTETTCFPRHDQGQFSCTNDMGFLGSAGWDPLFYSHHCNVDRLWHIWSTVLGGQGFTDADWLDASFVFYDDVHNPRKVRITFRDVLDTRNLGYTYDAESSKDLPWQHCKIVSLVPHGAAPLLRSSTAAAPVFPLVLTKGQVVQVPGVAVPPATEPGKEQVVLVIEGIEFDPLVPNKFDVAINVPADKASQVGPQYNEYAGSFSNVPASGGTRNGKVSLPINSVLSSIEADGDSTVDVVIVPRTNAKVTLNARPTIQIRE